MNRSDEIQAVARDIADWITPDAEERKVLADQLIGLVVAIVAAVGKSVAIDGESEMNEHDAGSQDAAIAWGRYMTGERIQEGIRWVREEAVGADLERWNDLAAPDWGWKPAGRAQARMDAFRRSLESTPEVRTVAGKTLRPLAPVADMDAARERRRAEASPFGPVQKFGFIKKSPTECGGTADGPDCDWDPSCTEHGILGPKS